ncbi:hypothetical protein MMC07_000123 [Pseudocyphellaria aurata]|nr:hypothetical protein [Pseudocyphellaria aurata]
MSRRFHLNQRLSYSKELCTVRYVGPITGTKGEWLGVEWDDPDRGKHNGTYQDMKYFECQSKSSKAGSFLRPSRPPDPPLGFEEALNQKYVLPQDGMSATAAENFLIDGNVVEERGFDRIQKQMATLSELRFVLLDGLCVAGMSARPWDETIETRMHRLQRYHAQRLKIVELDLSRNLIETWAEVAGICGGLRNLKCLKLNGNRFRDLSSPISGEYLESFPGVEELCLDETSLTWDEIVGIAKNFPSLTILSAASNNLTTITAPPPTPRLSSLLLSSNSIPSLASLTHLILLPQLKTLSLRSNPIQSLSSPAPLSTITHLNLARTLLASPSSLSSIPQSFPHLSSLVTTDTPLCAIPSASLLTIARLPALKSLNFSDVTVEERQNAEPYYLSQIARELAAVGSSDGERRRVLEEHPRYAELCEVYGDPAAPRDRDDLVPGTLEAMIVKFTFYLIDKEGKAVGEKKKDIPRSVDVYRVKGIVGLLFGIRPLGCRLVWETEVWDPVKGEEEGWSCSEEEDEVGNDESGVERDKVMRENEKGKWVRREMELEDGIKDVGFWIDGREARVRVELR